MSNCRRFAFVCVFLLTGCGLAWAGNGVDALIEQGRIQAGEGRMDDALATLTRAVEQYPDSSLAYTRLGGVRVLRQEYSRSIQDFQQAIMLDQGNANAFVGMAVAYLHIGRFSHAKGALTEAGKLDPSKKEQIAKVYAWIEKRSASGAMH